ncbi:MAG: choice-of-anchor J domain-containing protein, partial [Prevotellaceae bacterium]|nr:choice-of-anchor J domain-containing protein [Prevotellaceae bacterium]
MNKLITFFLSIILITAVNGSKLYGEAISAFPYTESFEYGNIENSPWVQYRLGEETDANWRTFHASPSEYVRTGSYSLFHETGVNAADDWLVSPQLYIPGDAVYLLSFWSVDQLDNAHGINSLHISKGSPDPESGDFVKVMDIPTDLSDWEIFHRTLNDFAGENIYLAFRYEGRQARRWYVEDLSIVRLFSSDAGVTEISRPVSDARLTGSETVTVKVKNFGSQALSNVQVRFEINGNPVAAETIQGSIASQEEVSYTFTAKANLQDVRTYTIKAYTVLSGEENASNDTTTIQVENFGDCTTNSVFPFTEGFEDNRIHSCWSIYNRDNYPDINWKVNKLQPRTGEYAIQHTYGYDEDGWLVTPKMRIPATGVCELSFWSFNRESSFYNYSPTIYGKNSVLISEGSGDPAGGEFQEVWSPISVTDSWVETVIDLAAYAGKEIYIAFRGENHNAHIWYIDDVSIYQLPAHDASVTAITAPPIKAKNLTANETVTIKVKNNGYETLANGIPVRLEVNGGIIATETVPGPIASKQEATFSFAAKADLSEVKRHTITVRALLEGDEHPEDDSRSIDVINYGTGIIADFPYTQDFENDDDLFLWTQETTDRNTSWTYRSGAMLGELTDKPHGGLRNACFYSLYGSGTTAKLITPPLNIRDLTAPVLKFWYGQEIYYGAGLDELRVYYRTSKTGAWKKLFEDKTEKKEWTEVRIDLPDPSEDYYIAFEGTARIGNGIVLDDVEITTAFTKDAALTALLSPVTDINLTSAETVTVRVKNSGTQTLTEIPVRLKVDELPEISETVSCNLSTFEETEYTFNTRINLSEEKIHTLKIYLALPGDEYLKNDTLSVEVENYGNKAIMGRETAFTSCDVVFTDEGVNGKYSNRSETQTVTFYPSETGKRIKAEFTAFHTQAFEIFMGMPIYGDTLFVYDGTILDEKYKIGALSGDLNEDLPEPFVSHAADGSLTFVFKKIDAIPQDGWEALISCITPEPYDAGIIAVLSPLKGGNATAPVTVEIKNYGGEPLSAINLAYRFNGGAPVSGQYAGTIPPGETAEYTFAQTVDVSAFDDNYAIEAWTLFANDSDRSNDTIAYRFAYRENIVLQGYRIQADLPADQWGGISFNSNDPATVTPIRPYQDADNRICAGERVGDFIYLYSYNLSVAYTVNFIQLTKEWEFVSQKAVSNVNAWPIEMAYDHSTDKLYAVTYPGDASYIYTIDPATGNWTLFNQIDDYVVGLACHSGTMYLATVWGDVISVALQTGQITPICSIGMFAPYLQSLTCDPQTGRLFWAMKNDFSSILIEIDPATGRWFNYGQIGENAQIIGLHVSGKGSAIAAPQTDGSSIAVYPNPSDGQVTISNVPEKSSIRISDLSGKTIE